MFLKEKEVSKEKLAERINTLEDLMALKSDLDSKDKSNRLYRKLAQDVNTEILEILQLARENQIDLPKTLMAWFIMKDSNKVFEYSKHLQEDVLTGNEGFE